MTGPIQKMTGAKKLTVSDPKNDGVGSKNDGVASKNDGVKSIEDFPQNRFDGVLRKFLTGLVRSIFDFLTGWFWHINK